MLDFEYKVIIACLSGNHPVFGKLISQLNFIAVKERTGDSGSYRLEFEYTGPDRLLLAGAEASMVISDVCFEIGDSDDMAYAELMVLHGRIHSLSINSDASLEDHFTVRRVYWETLNLDKGEVRKSRISDPLDRDYTKAIGYIPAYK